MSAWRYRDGSNGFSGALELKLGTTSAVADFKAEFTLEVVRGDVTLVHTGICSTTGCAISHLFTVQEWSAGKKAVLTIRQRGDLDALNEYV